MGTLRYAVVPYAKMKGNGNAVIMGSKYRIAASYTTSTSASFVEASSVDITCYPDEVFYGIASEDMVIRFGGSAATANLGIPVAAGTPFWVEVQEAGKVSAIDIA